MEAVMTGTGYAHETPYNRRSPIPDGQLLFKDGDWELRQHPLSERISSRLWHQCDGHWWYVWTTNPQCVHCKQPPPAELMGLKTLHDWKR